MADTLGALAQRIAAIEARTSRQTEAQPSVPLQCAAIDEVLPSGGLARGAVHEMVGPVEAGSVQGDGALMGFASLALSRLLAADEGLRPALWCMNRRLQHAGGLLSGYVYAPGLQAMDVPLNRLLLAYTNNDSETLWAMEEALRSGAVAAVLGELNRLEPLAARRLQLAAQAHGSTALVLWPGREVTSASFAETRWRLSTLPSLGQMIESRWLVSLVRARRSAVSQDWAVQWRGGRLLASLCVDRHGQDQTQDQSSGTTGASTLALRSVNA
ncbi:MAG: ImuA family protein [Alphaproteobacteria bacterium]|jgi:protein ImuA